MFSNVALDVFLGLVFVFLLYSLLATIVMEFIAHYMHMRPRILMKALRRMLEDNPAEVFGKKQHFTILDFFSDAKESVKRFFYPFNNLPFLRRFYYHPTIKYLGQSRSSSKPSYMQPDNFSQTIIQLFRGQNEKEGLTQTAAIERYLFAEAPRLLAEYNRYLPWLVNADFLNKQLKKEDLDKEELLRQLAQFKNNIFRYKTRRVEIEKLMTQIAAMNSIDDVRRLFEPGGQLRLLEQQVAAHKISAETLLHFQNLFIDAQHDLDRFRLRLEKWFEETMERASGWYKRQTQVILLSLGLLMAAWGNVDALKIYKLLSKDKKAREQMVALAIQSQDKYAPIIDSIKRQRTRDTVLPSAGDSQRVRMVFITTNDSLLTEARQAVLADMAQTENILGLGWCVSDSCKRYQKLKDSLAVQQQSPDLQKLADDHNQWKQIWKRIPELDADSQQKFVQHVWDHRSFKEKKENLVALANIAQNNYKAYREQWNLFSTPGLLSLAGWLITALAISLGAPFWFDMLNKVVRLRSANKTTATSSDAAVAATATAATQGAAPLTVNVNPSNAGEEAVG